MAINSEEEKTLDFKVIKNPLNKVIEFFINKTDREFPIKNNRDAREVLLTLAYVAKNTYRSIFFLCDMVSKNPARKIEYSLSSISLLRLLLEEVFTLCFLSEDFAEKIVWYCKAGWREMKEEYDRFLLHYGNDLNWKLYVAKYKEVLSETQKIWRITNEEVANIKIKIKYWPIPGQMIRDCVKSEELKDFMQYLQDWFYKQFSQVAHLSWPGLSVMGTYFLEKERDPDGQAKFIEKMRSDCSFHAVTLIAAFFSEMENILKFGNKKDLQFVWGVIIKYWNYAKELYEKRYQNLLLR
jgi:hypothetical protein